MTRAAAAALFALALALAAVPANAQVIDEASPGDAPPPSGSAPFCSACVVVAAGVVLVIAAIPMFVQAERATRREDGVLYGRSRYDCADSPAACAALSSADIDATPWWIGGGVTGGIGVVAIASGVILAWQVPSTRGERVGVRVSPALDASGGAVRVDLSF